MPVANAKNIREWFKDWFKHEGLDGAAVSRELAAAIKNPHLTVDDRLELANELLDGYGIEAIEGGYWVDNYYHHAVALYVNVGDSYAPTILFETDIRRFLVTTWGDWVEKNQRKYDIE